MLFNLDNLLDSNDLLHDLEAPFTRQEIDEVVADLPNNKSPGPDGFNNEFIKSSWPLIAPDFYNLFEAFF